MNARRTLASVVAAAAITLGSVGAAHAAPQVTTTKTVTTTTVTVTTVTKAVKALPKKQQQVNAVALRAADAKCGKWTAKASKKTLDCRWTALKAAGYVAPKIPAKAYDSGEGTPDPGTREWERAYGKALAPDAPPASDSLAVSGPTKPRGTR